MAKMSQKMMDMINSNFCYWATSDRNGMPHNSLQGSTTAISPDTILLVPRFKKITYKNLQENPKAAVIVYSSLPHEKTKAQNEELALITGF